MLYIKIKHIAECDINGNIWTFELVNSTTLTGMTPQIDKITYVWDGEYWKYDHLLGMPVNDVLSMVLNDVWDRLINYYER